MGNEKSRHISADCSLTSFTNERDLDTVISTRNYKCNVDTKNSAAKRNGEDEFSKKLKNLRSKKESENTKDKDLDFVMTKIDKPKTRPSCAKSCKRKISLLPLTASEQLEEVETVFKEKEREKAEPTCCDCAKSIRRMEKRNGLQRTSTPQKNCQCCSCKEQFNKLSEAQAIADAIHEYCCRERKRAMEIIRKERKGHKVQRCCKCNAKLDGKGSASDEEIDEDSDAEDDDCCCTQFKEYPKGKEKCCKCAAASRGKTEQKEESEEEDNDEAIEEEQDISAVESEAADEQEDSNDAAEELDEDVAAEPIKQQQSKKHARGCTCCDCKKSQQNVTSNSENEAHISVDDIEFEVQGKNAKTARPGSQAKIRASSRNSETRMQSQNQRGGVRTQQKVSEVQETETEILHEREVFVKKTNLSGQSEDDDSEYALAAKTQKARLSQRDPSDDGPHVQGCRCCDCKKAAESKKRSSVKYESVGRISEHQSSLNASQRRGTSSPRSSRETHPTKPGNYYTRKESEQEEQEYETNQKRRRSSDRPEEHVLGRDRAPERYQDSKSSQQPREEKRRPSDRHEEEALARDRTHERYRDSQRPEKPRRNSRYEDDGGSLSIKRHSQGCTCCECKKQTRTRKTEYDYTAADEHEEETVAEIEVEVEEQRKKENKSCCCFTRKRSTNESLSDYRPTSDKRNDKKRRDVKNKNTARDDRRSSSRARGSAGSESRQRQSRRCECTCRKNKRVPLTKCCLCTHDARESALAVSAGRESAENSRQRDEDKERHKLAEELADRIQRRAALQIELQQRLQEQKKAKQKQCCCCCDPSSAPQPCCCFTPIPCCEQGFCAPPPQPCSFQTKPCCFTPPQPEPLSMFCEPPICCGYKPQQSYGQECPCCCQQIPFCYAATCSFTKPGATNGLNPG